MPEIPDFNQIARTLADALDEDFTMARADRIYAKVAEQLRLVWNARGAADTATLDATLRTDATNLARVSVGTLLTDMWRENVCAQLRKLDC